ncbi:MAG: DUF3311 domain-containing protein [Acidobacteria bacterium]|nr:DUF3311 domain-containing protein [Acidobacteriota bacterium]
MRPMLIAIAITVMYALHQDVWLWRTARPLLFGFLPAGLAYHAGYTLACAVLMAVVVRVAWPAHVEGRES